MNKFKKMILFAIACSLQLLPFQLYASEFTTSEETEATEKLPLIDETEVDPPEVTEEIPVDPPTEETEEIPVEPSEPTEPPVEEDIPPVEHADESEVEVEEEYYAETKKLPNAGINIIEMIIFSSLMVLGGIFFILFRSGGIKNGASNQKNKK